ncbi:Na+/H+-dicarboxylate symporter [Clostridium tetanomorphum]|uniref:Dicarboxylate/amino acid:cation symporter n=1 Tax=Clostridium tetanomorphum TaxID=1553 RepID=A0A923E505_CLOTT|nr:dicarboxylate/amino acid:cation symporter [Clostridium tetanomorphum]KAJ49476.1 serine/threonine sodium symporter [Clostridium tetanomorphum DSM 665]KAJ51447.1 serine/threonine sodium symporter [Clostridium tetanomorphum DSM 665]MBC2396540.1 dicarboxylate/amino acid:cation symporter [Clostridium tetanomorphum]MBP1863866.1 Na+/H+-dicarboxylate symporter [Clostridium tetanomorphum]NRS84944.1 Na+/H+-dicarboxylate symporter [Clostridium tetanomorphum]
MGSKKFHLGLIPKILIGILIGVLIGKSLPVWFTRIFITFSSIFGNFLGFIVPLLILGFVTAGIAELGTGAGKLLGITVGIAYLFTLISGFFAYGVGKTLLPLIITNDTTKHISSAAKDLEPFFKVDMPPVMNVMTALILAFLLGLGIAAINSKPLRKIAEDFQAIITKAIENIIIPLLPVHIVGIFANMTYTGQVATVFSVFWKVFIIIICSHIIILLFQFTISCSISKKNVFKSLKLQIPGYLTALGTQSSAATIPVNLKCAENIGTSKGIREFVIPLCATTHMSGSTITLTTCAMSVMMLNSMPVTLGNFAGFIAMLGISIVAAPGVPGGAVMASLGALESILGFSKPMLTLMIALYIAQDSFGTACNVSGDQAVGMIVDKIQKNSSTIEESSSVKA